MQRSLFWNSTAGDIREYNAAEFANYFNKFISDGVYSENGALGLKVKVDSGFNIKVETGSAYIQGYLYENTEELSFTLDGSDSSLSRIDRVVLHWDEALRKIEIKVKKGLFSSNPIPPELEDTPTTKELSLARVLVNYQASTVAVIDERLTDVCGQVSLLIDIPFADLEGGWQDWLSTYVNEWNLWKNGEQSDFEGWVSNFQTQIDETTEGSLISLIDTKMDKTKIHISSEEADIDAMAEGDIWIKYEV